MILNYIEIDCRNHIGKQIDEKGRHEDTVIEDFVNCYFDTIKTNVSKYKCVVVVALIPPTEIMEFEAVNGPLTNEYPFVGTDYERVRFTVKMNALLRSKCSEYRYIFLICSNTIKMKKDV